MERKDVTVVTTWGIFVPKAVMDDDPREQAARKLAAGWIEECRRAEADAWRRGHLSFAQRVLLGR